MKTKFKSSKIGKKELPIVVRTLRSIEKETGVLTPEIVVTKASNKKHPLHKYFTWDDTKAAELYRYWEARNLIQAVSVTFIDSGGKEQSVRAFVNVKPDEMETDDVIPGQGYISISRSAKSGSYQEQVMEYARNQLLGWKRRFGHIRDFFGVVSEIEKL